jgi:hypothetical protein
VSNIYLSPLSAVPGVMMLARVLILFTPSETEGFSTTAAHLRTVPRRQTKG